MKSTKPRLIKNKKGDKTLEIVIGVILLLFIAYILFSQFQSSIKPLETFRKDCEAHGGFLVNTTCDSSISMRSPLSDEIPGANCCLRGPGIPKDEFEEWVKKHEYVEPEKPVEVIKPIRTDGTSAPAQYTESSDESSESAPTSPNNNRIPSALGHLHIQFYSAQRNNKHYCGLALLPQYYESYEDEKKPFILSNISISYAWQRNVEMCKRVSENDAQTKPLTGVGLFNKEYINISAKNLRQPCFEFTIDKQVLSHDLKIGDVRCDYLYVGAIDAIHDLFVNTDGSSCSVYGKDENKCLDFTKRIEDLKYSLDCYYGRDVSRLVSFQDSCRSCEPIRTCQDYPNKESCISNQCLVKGNFAPEDIKCFWKEQGRSSECLPCGTCSSYTSKSACEQSKNSCGTTCGWISHLSECVFSG